jgi:type VII secretion protein EccB
MPSTPTTKSQVQAYRFVLRRMESALVRRDPVMLHDPMRSHKRATVVGAIAGVVGLVGFLLFAVLKPSPVVPNSGIVIAQPSGSVFVVSQNPHELIPVFNVVSGRLLLAAAQQQQQSPDATSRQAPTLVKPVTVSDQQLRDLKIPVGQMTGIPDGPTALPNPGQQATTWAVCDEIQLDRNAPDPAGHKAPVTTALVGVSNIGQNINPDQALLVSSDAGRTLNLVYGLVGNVNSPNDSAVRAQVDTGDPTLLQALGIERDDYRSISSAVLDAIPSVSEIRNPLGGINLDGQVRPRLAALGLRIGQPFQVQLVGGGYKYYIVVPGGMEQVSNTTATIARFENPHDNAKIKTVAPHSVDGVPAVHDQEAGGLRTDVANYPSGRVPTIISANSRPVMCLGWHADLSNPDEPLAKTRVTVDFNLRVPMDPNTGHAMQMVPVQRSSSTGRIGWFFMNPSLGGVAVRAATNPGEFGSGQIYVIDPRGVAYSVPDLYTAEVIGVANNTQPIPPAPQSIVGLLPSGGQQLDTQAVQWTSDGMHIPASAGQFLPGDTQADNGQGAGG